MTQFEIVAAVMNLVTSHEGVTNTSLSEGQVAAEVHTCRQRMMDDMDKVALFRKPYIGFTQTISELAVQKNNLTGELYALVPRVYRMRNNEIAIGYIGGKDGKSPYRIITGDTSENYTHDQFLAKKAVAIYEDGVFKFRNISPKFVWITGVFEYPDQLAIHGYDDEETSYPMPGGLIDQLIGKTAESYIRTMYRVMPQPNTQSDIPNARPNGK